MFRTTLDKFFELMNNLTYFWIGLSFLVAFGMSFNNNSVFYARISLFILGSLIGVSFLYVFGLIFSQKLDIKQPIIEVFRNSSLILMLMTFIININPSLFNSSRNFFANFNQFFNQLWLLLIFFSEFLLAGLLLLVLFFPDYDAMGIKSVSKSSRKSSKAKEDKSES